MGGTRQFAASARDAAGNTLTGRPVMWSSGDQTVSAVSSSGMALAIASGVTTITASIEGQTASALFTVLDAGVATLGLAPGAANVVVGGSQQLVATVRDAAGTILSGRIVSWASSNAAVASVAASGLVTALAVGSATITATSEGQSGVSVVTVVPLPPVVVASIAVIPGAPTMQLGGTQQLAATTRDASGNVLVGRSVTWTSANATVASVSASGLVTALAIGNATITATSEGQSGSSAVTVVAVPQAAVASVAVTPGAASILPGGSQQFLATLRDAGGTVLDGRAVSWMSSDPAVASISATGLVTAQAVGTATITATSEGRAGTASVTVNGLPVATVVVSPQAVTVQARGTQQLVATLRDANDVVLLDRAVTWASSNTNVVAISTGGVVTGGAVGTATVTAMSEGRMGFTTITVIPGPAVVLHLNPSAAYLTWPSGTGQVDLVAVARDLDGNEVIVSPVWQSSDPSVIVNQNGRASAFGRGVSTISATFGGLVGTATVGSECVPARCSRYANTSFTQMPTAVRAGEIIAPAVQLGVQSIGSVWSGGTAFLFLGQNSAGGTLTGNAPSVMGSYGTVTWSSLRIDKPGTYTLVALIPGSSGVLGATSTTIVVTP